MQNNTILYDTENASIVYMKRLECIYIALEGFLEPETFVEFSKAFVKGTVRCGAHRFLFDTSRVNVISSNEMLLFANSFLLYKAKNHISKIAFIKPDNAFGVKSIESIANMLKSKIVVCVFPSMELAESWLYRD